MYEIVFYEDARGESPVHDLIVELNNKAFTDKKARVLLEKVIHYVERLKVKGTWNGLPFTKFLEDGIWELRPGNLRILFFVLNEKYVLLHFFFKTTNKTPRMELEHAKKERDDWLNRHFADHEN